MGKQQEQQEQQQQEQRTAVIRASRLHTAVVVEEADEFHAKDLSENESEPDSEDDDASTPYGA